MSLGGGSLLCVSVVGSTVKSCLDDVAEAKRQGADLVELRLDSLERDGGDWRELLDCARERLPVIVTNRASWEGGGCSDNEDTRLMVLVEAEARGAEFVDVELKAVTRFAELRRSNLGTSGAKLILSWHDFDRARSREELSEIWAKMLHEGADICKIAVMARSISDNIPLLELLELASSKHHPTIALAMGEAGTISRILAGKFGGFLSFASLMEGKESAPGQVSVSHMIGMYRFKDINESTGLYGIVANPVAHSMSPAIHNPAFRECGLDKVYVPLLVDDLTGFFDGFLTSRFSGLSVSIPHKETIRNLVDDVDDIAGRIGAVNTVVIDKITGKSKGYNTDWIGAIEAVENVLKSSSSLKEQSRSLSGKRVVLIGAGGAARGLAFGALHHGVISLHIVNRTRERAEILAQELRNQSPHAVVDSMSTEEFIREGLTLETDVYMNSTSVGMHPNMDDTPVPKDFLRRGGSRTLVFDAVYNPMETRLLKEAKDCGCMVADGVEMFVGQAVKQFELWTGLPAPRELMRQTVLHKLTAQ